jgi:hypothetical protein
MPFGNYPIWHPKSNTLANSDGAYIGWYFGTGASGGQSPSTIARNLEVEVLEQDNCEVTLLDSPVQFIDTDDMPENLAPTKTTEAFNMTAFNAFNTSTAVGLQETGDANTNNYDRTVLPNTRLVCGAASGQSCIGFVGADGKYYGIAQTSNNGTAKVLNTGIEFDPDTLIYQTGGTYKAGDLVGKGYMYPVFPGHDLRYSCNQGSWMTANKPVYMVLHPSSSGLYTLEGPTIFTQTLPSTADGLYYKLVGYAYSAYQIDFNPSGSLIWHDGTKLCGGNGPKGDPGPQGPAYTLTESDKATIVQSVLEALPNADNTGY